MRGLPLMVVASLVQAAGILLGMRMPAPQGGFLLCLVAAVLAAANLVGVRHLALAACLASGVALGDGARAATIHGCMTDLRDGEHLVLAGTPTAEPLPDATTPFLVSRRLAPRPVSCRVVLRVRAGRPRATLPPAGHEARLEGRWLAIPPNGPWPRPMARAGVLMADRIKATGRPSWWAHPVLRLRGRAQARIRAVFGNRAPMAEALLLARKEGLDPATRDRFARAGLSHVLAISGLHVGIIFGLTLALGISLVGRARAVVGASCIALAYVAFLGAPHSALRAALMILLFGAARLLQRPADPLALLAAAGMVIMVREPAAVLDAGFQLSFAGTAGIVVLRRPLDALFQGRVHAWLRGGLAASLAATVATAPIAALHFGRAAPVGILANIVGIPLVGLAVPATALSVLTGCLWLPAGSFLAGGAGVLLAALDGVARVAGAVPGGHTSVQRGLALALALGALTVVLAVRGLVRWSRARGVALGAACLILAVGPATVLPDAAMELHVVDVGQGDAIAIRSPRGRWLLVDAGPRTDRYDAGRSTVVPYLLRHGTRSLEALILTHPDGDHIGGAAAVLDALNVRAVLDPGAAAGKSLYIDVVDRAGARDRTWYAARTGRRIELDGVVVEILYPDDVHLDVNESANDVSVVLKVVYGRFSALLLGDAPAEVETRLIDRFRAAMDVDVVKLGHHGSATSTSQALLDATTPELALVSVGRRNRYGHPSPAVLARLRGAAVRVLRTDRRGSIIVRAGTDGRMVVHTER